MSGKIAPGYVGTRALRNIQQGYYLPRRALRLPFSKGSGRQSLEIRKKTVPIGMQRMGWDFQRHRIHLGPGGMQLNA
ncbi:MAG: hypothetical protein VX252_10185 [Myxococcota bacterium]|nr:hypothetical protein [Myxococcota bacterium]